MCALLIQENLLAGAVKGLKWFEKHLSPMSSVQRNTLKTKQKKKKKKHTHTHPHTHTKKTTTTTKTLKF